MIYFSLCVICGPKCENTCLSHCHRTCWGYSADLLWSGTVWGRNPGPPGPQSSGSYPQRRPLSWTRWAASAGRGAGSCRTAAEGPGGSWRRWTVSNRCALYWTVCFLWKRVTWCFVEPGDSPVLFCLCGKVHILINRGAVTHSSKNFWRPTILSVICCALFRLKKGFLGGRSGSFVLQWGKKKHTANIQRKKTGAEFAVFWN